MKKKMSKFLLYFCVGAPLLIAGAISCSKYLTENKNSEHEDALLKQEQLALPPPLSLMDVYNYLHTNYSAYENITFAKPTVNILRGNNWLLQTPDIWGYDLNDYASVFCNKNQTRPGGGATPCDPCFNLPTCNTVSDCKGSGTPTNFPVTCEIPNFVNFNTNSHPITCLDGTQLNPNQKLCLSHAQTNLVDFYSAITSARSAIDITGLSAGNPLLTDQDFHLNAQPIAPPDSIFYVIKKALTDLSYTGRKITVRILGGIYPSVTPGNEMTDFLTVLTQDFAKNNQLTIVVVPQRTCPSSPYFPIIPDTTCGNLYQTTNDTFAFAWNHGKILLIDKTILFEGGQNFYGYDYLLTDLSAIGPTAFTPVNDALIRYEGPVALGASNFVDTLFGYLTQVSGSDSDFCTYYSNGKITVQSLCAQKWSKSNGVQREVIPEVNDISVMSMFTSKLNSLNYLIINGVKFGNDADESEPARFYAMSNATRSVKIAQQSLFIGGRSAFDPNGDGTTWPAFPGATSDPNPTLTMDGIVNVFKNNINAHLGITDRTVQIVTTSTPQSDGYGAYVDLNHVFQYICSSLQALGISKTTAQNELHKNLSLAYFSYKNASTVNGGPAHHNKFWMVDENIFYFGSHNFYPSSLQQFGVISEGLQAVNILLNEFWNPLWSNADRSRFDVTTTLCD